MEVYLIRHTTPLIDEGLIYGRLDVPVLEERFEEEKNQILDRLITKFETVYSSPSVRCKRLAEQIGEKVYIDERLFEYNFGEWEGKNWNSLDKNETETWMKDFVNVKPNGGETLVEMQVRVLDFWKDLKKTEPKLARVGIITHGGVIRLIKGSIDQTPLKEIFAINVKYGEVIQIVV